MTDGDSQTNVVFKVSQKVAEALKIHWESTAITNISSKKNLETNETIDPV